MIPVTIVMTVITRHPPSPFHCLVTLTGGAIGFRRLPTPWARMTGPTWLFGVESQTNEMAFVAKEPPDFPADGRVVAIISPFSSYTSSPACRFKRFQGFHSQQRAAMHLTQEQQHIACQMSQGAIALFIFAPTAHYLAPIERKSLVHPGSFGVIGEQRIPPLFVCGHLFLQLVDLSSGACLSAIKTARVQEHWPAYLFVVFVHGGSRE